MHTGQNAHFDTGIFSAFLDQVMALGLRFRISELDVTEDNTALPADQRDAQVAEAAWQVLSVATTKAGLAGVTCWGLSDRYSWIPPESESAGLNRGLPFDSDLRAKPMYYVIRDLLNPVQKTP